MPELPEVEHVVRILNTVLPGRTIKAAKLLSHRLVPAMTKAAFASQLKGAKIDRVHRRGKHILFGLSNGRTLIAHLRMTGCFSLLTPDSVEPKHIRAVFFLGEDSRLVFDDPRHFGVMRIVKTPQLYEGTELNKLAPEPFSDEFSIGYARETLGRSKKQVKELLLDQTKFCGVGNIYAAEALFLAGIDPRMIASRLSKPKADRLRLAIKQVLGEAIEYSASAEPDPANLKRTYSGKNGWRVYDREGTPCEICEKPIKRIKQGGRSTFYCPRCQK